MIELRNVSKKFGSVSALDSLSFLVGEGSFFGLVGPNGAGKTTTINILTGVVRSDSGQVKMSGNNFETRSIELKKEIGVMPEGMALFDGLTGEEHLTFVSRVYGIAKEEAKRRVEELLALFELNGAGAQLIHTYSQGMKKKLSFAAAIIHKPKILFLDEPFESVDPIQRKIMREILRTMQQNGATIVLTSHTLETVEALCDEVAIMNKGRIVFQSRTEDIRKKIKDEVSQETYQSLEEIFIDVVSQDGTQKEKRKLSWL